MPILRTTGVLAAAALVLAGCGAEQGTATTMSQTTTTTTPPPPTAKDGADYAACADGVCEVAIDKPVTIDVAGTSFVVKGMLEDGLEFDVTFANGGGATGTMKGTCGSIISFYTSGTGGMSGVFCALGNKPQPAPEPKPGLLQLQMSGFADRTAIVRIVAG